MPDSVPLDRAELRAFVESRYGEIVHRYASRERTRSPEYDGLIQELGGMQPGELGRPENRDRARELLARYMDIAQRVAARTGNTSEGAELRTLYNDVEQVDFPLFMQQIAHLPPQVQAAVAHRLREELKVLVRDLMSDTSSTEVLYLRDRAVYGHRRGPAFDDLFDRSLARANGDADEAYRLLIGGSQRSNTTVNQRATGSETGRPGS